MSGVLVMRNAIGVVVITRGPQEATGPPEATGPQEATGRQEATGGFLPVLVNQVPPVRSMSEPTQPGRS